MRAEATFSLCGLDRSSHDARESGDRRLLDDRRMF
jgi:hypothetical protein